jgi:hypothetical protein
LTLAYLAADILIGLAKMTGCGAIDDIQEVKEMVCLWPN